MATYLVLTSRTVRKPNLRVQFTSDELARAREFYETRVFDLKEITRRGGVVLVRQTDEGTEVLESTWFSGAPEEIRYPLRGLRIPRRSAERTPAKGPEQLALWNQDRQDD